MKGHFEAWSIVSNNLIGTFDTEGEARAYAERDHDAVLVWEDADGTTYQLPSAERFDCAPGAAADVAWSVHRNVVTLRTEFEQKGFELGQALARIQRERLYELLGHDTFESYLADPEVSVSRRHAYRLITVARAYVPSMAHEVAAMGVAKAEMVAPLVRDAADEFEAQGWIDQAIHQSTSDLRQTVREARGEAAIADEALRELASAIGGLAAKLPYADKPADVLDTIAEKCMTGIARLRGGA